MGKVLLATCWKLRNRLFLLGAGHKTLWIPWFRDQEKKHRKYRGFGRTRREKHGENGFFTPTLFKQHINTIYLTIFLALKGLKNMQQQQQQKQLLLFQAPQNGSAAREFLRLSPASLTVRNEPKSEPHPPHTP